MATSEYSLVQFLSSYMLFEPNNCCLKKVTLFFILEGKFSVIYSGVNSIMAFRVLPDEASTTAWYSTEVGLLKVVKEMSEKRSNVKNWRQNFFRTRRGPMEPRSPWPSFRSKKCRLLAICVGAYQGPLSLFTNLYLRKQECWTEIRSAKPLKFTVESWP